MSETAGKLTGRPPVMADVARIAGVSHQTVSRVLNAHPNVSASARQRVEAAIAELGYRRNGSARALVTRQNMTFGVITMDTSHYGPSSMLTSIADAARAAGYFVNLATLERIDRQSMQSALDFLAGAVDGIVVIVSVASAMEAIDAAVEAVEGLPARVPLVLAQVDRGDVPSVAVDQELGARLATRHLIELGHTRILHVSGPGDWHEAVARVRGWRAEMADHGLRAATPLTGDWSPESGYQAGLRLLRRKLPTGVFVANDQMALGLLKAFREHGVSVPEDVSVIGFDDIPEAAYLAPPLSTIRQDFGEMGRRCIDRLLGLVSGDWTASEPVLAPALIVRDSTAAVPAR